MLYKLVEQAGPGLYGPAPILAYGIHLAPRTVLNKTIMMKASTVDHGTTMVHNWPFVSQIIHHDGFVQYSSWS